MSEFGVLCCFSAGVALLFQGLGSVRSVPGHNQGWLRARLGVWEHKSNIYLTCLSLPSGREASSSAGNLSNPFALVQHSGLSQLALPVAGLERCLLSGVCREAGASPGWEGNTTFSHLRGFGVEAPAVLSVFGG